MRTLLDFSPEVIAKICEYLRPKDIVALSESCKELYQASQIDSVWKHRCQKDYGIKVDKKLEVSYRDLYTKLLHQYGKLIGLWLTDITYYGGLLQIEYNDGCLFGKELHPPHDPQITDPLRVHPLFTIRFDQKGELLFLCLAGYGESHAAYIDLTGYKQFSFKCCDHSKHSHPGGRHQEFLDWLKEESARPFEPREMMHSQELLLMKFLLLKQYNCLYEFNYLELPTKISGVPIQPGMFKGTYGAHGLELILVTYEEQDSLIKALKVTGDPNVPARELTFHVNLNFPMTLTSQDQESMANLSAIQAVEVPFHKSDKKPQNQPFLVPPDCFERFSDIPKFCIGRYHGWGQIAGHGFENPSFSPGHWIIFHEDMFAFIWLDLKSISVYHRVQELS